MDEYKIKSFIRNELYDFRKDILGSENIRISKIFGYWLDNFFILLNNGFLPKEACLHLEEWHFKKEIKKEKPFFLKIILRRIISLLPIPKVFYLYGKSLKRNLINTISYINLKTKLENQKINFNRNDRTIFKERLKDHVPKTLLDSIFRVLPDFFFYKNFVSDSMPEEIHLASGHIFQYPWNLIFLNKKNIKVVGYQHGGNYGEFLNNKYEEFELDFFDEFFYWGLGDKNIEQTRFSTMFLNNSYIKNILWVGMFPNIFAEKNIYGSAQINHDLQEFQSLKKDSSIYKDFIFLEHPKIKKSQTFFKKNMHLTDIKKNMLSESVVILPFPGSTVFYQCLYQDIPFVLFLNDSWKKYLSVNYVDLLKFIKKEKKLFWWSEEKDFLSFISSINKDKLKKEDLSNKNILDYFNQIIKVNYK
tara:strand:+ start:3557 stop:4807 length:1251 start_codon:yes stop_codon:yes gene_type:complete